MEEHLGYASVCARGVFDLFFSRFSRTPLPPTMQLKMVASLVLHARKTGRESLETGTVDAGLRARSRTDKRASVINRAGARVRRRVARELFMRDLPLIPLAPSKDYIYKKGIKREGIINPARVGRGGKLFPSIFTATVPPRGVKIRITRSLGLRVSNDFARRALSSSRTVATLTYINEQFHERLLCSDNEHLTSRRSFVQLYFIQPRYYLKITRERCEFILVDCQMTGYEIKVLLQK